MSKLMTEDSQSLPNSKWLRKMVKYLNDEESGFGDEFIRQTFHTTPKKFRSMVNEILNQCVMMPEGKPIRLTEKKKIKVSSDKLFQMPKNYSSKEPEIEEMEIIYQKLKDSEDKYDRAESVKMRSVVNALHTIIGTIPSQDCAIYIRDPEMTNLLTQDLN